MPSSPYAQILSVHMLRKLLCSAQSHGTWKLIPFLLWWIFVALGWVDHALHEQLLGLQHEGHDQAPVPHVCVHHDQQLLGLPPPGCPSLFPVLDNHPKVCRHNPHVPPAEPLLAVAGHNGGEPNLVPLPSHVHVGAAPGAVPGASHDLVPSGRSEAGWQAWRPWALLIQLGHKAQTC